MRSACLAIFFALTYPVVAEIHADFTVSSGGEPLGAFRVRLDFEKAPRTCANFIGLATGERPWVDLSSNRIVANKPFYDGLIFHRLIHNFMIQGGSSNGQGTAGAGYVIQDEFHPDLRHSGRYVLSMAKANFPGTGNSQFFITLEAASHLDDKHSVFGEVIEGREIIDGFSDAELFPTDRSVAGTPANDTDYFDRPVSEIRIDSVVISGESLADFDIHDPALELPSFSDARPLPIRNQAASSFTTVFERKARHDYLYSYSLDLDKWIWLEGARNFLSIDAETEYDLTVTGVTFDRFFAMVGAVDYSFLENPDVSLFGAGSEITFTNRGGESLTLFPDGEGGGTWIDSHEGSGAINEFTVTDKSPVGRFPNSEATQAHLLPLLGLNFILDDPGGLVNRERHQLSLDFREPHSGWIDGLAGTVEGHSVVSFLHAFTVVPAP